MQPVHQGTSKTKGSSKRTKLAEERKERKKKDLDDPSGCSL